MKVPLSFQITEYDCGTTSLINVFTYLFDREDIPVSLLKTIYRYTLDAEGENGVIGEAGTSRDAIENFANWLNASSIKAKASVLRNESVTISSIKECINNSGCVLARCYQEGEHYALITNIDDGCAYIFDPYYLSPNIYDDDDEVTMIFNENFSYNRVVTLTRLFSESIEDFSLMETNKREVVLFYKQN